MTSLNRCFKTLPHPPACECRGHPELCQDGTLIVTVWVGRVYGGGKEGERWGNGGGRVASRIPSNVPFWHTNSSSFRLSISNRCHKNLLSPLIPKNTVESTQRRKAAKTQGFRLVGSFTRWVSKFNHVFSPHLPSPDGFASWRLCVSCRFQDDPGKLAVAARVSKETTLPVKWIAERLQMGTSKSLKPMLLRWIQACGKSANQSQPTKAPCQQLQFQPPV